MSTTHDLQVAVRYAMLQQQQSGLRNRSGRHLLFKLSTRNFRERGADLSFISCFEHEAEVLFPPLTHLAPTDQRTVKELSDLEAKKTCA